MSLAETIAPIGHNNPPQSPYEAVRAMLDDLRTEAANWLDGAEIADDSQAEAVSRLMDELRQGKKAADDARKLEAKPFDDGKAEVQARYNPLLKSADSAIDGIKTALGIWLRKKEDAQRKAAEEARKEAERIAAEAAAAMREANPIDLAETEQAAALVEQAERAAKDAAAAEKARAHATGGARAVGLRSYFTPKMTDQKAAMLHYMREQPQRFIDLCMDLAASDVRSGKRQIPGFEIVEERRAV